MNAVAVEMEFEPVVDAAGPTLLKQQVGERLAAHRSRRAKAAGEGGVIVAETAARNDAGAPSRAQRIASAVAERYSHSPSYHAFLAAEAEEATRRAQAAAEVAARTAQAVAAAQRELLEELAAAGAGEARQRGNEEARELGMTGESARTPEALMAEFADEPRATVTQGSRAGLSVKLFEDAGRLAQRGSVEPEGRTSGWSEPALDDPEEARALDEEISFRQSPTFELDRPSVAIPGNLLEFPRQLVAARKARPRYAEGPLLEDGAHDGTQLRIFEVEAEQLAATPPVESSAAEWSSIWLDAPAVSALEQPTEAVRAPAMPFATASVERRVMAAIVDWCLVLAGYVGFATVFAYRAAALPTLGFASMASVGAIAALFAIYQALFFTFSEATPGMRYARIGLCTFDDENPTRAAMQKRIFAVLLAGCPLGLGFLWAAVDDDRLGWHDRISHMYQRGY